MGGKSTAKNKNAFPSQIFVTPGWRTVLYHPCQGFPPTSTDHVHALWTPQHTFELFHQTCELKGSGADIALSFQPKGGSCRHFKKNLNRQSERKYKYLHINLLKYRLGSGFCIFQFQWNQSFNSVSMGPWAHTDLQLLSRHWAGFKKLC